MTAALRHPRPGYISESPEAGTHGFFGQFSDGPIPADLLTYTDHVGNTVVRTKESWPTCSSAAALSLHAPDCNGELLVHTPDSPW